MTKINLMYSLASLVFVTVDYQRHTQTNKQVDADLPVDPGSDTARVGQPSATKNIVTDW